MTNLPELGDLLACPVDGSPLRLEGEVWVSENGRRYPCVQGIPVLFHPDVDNTMEPMEMSRSLTRGECGQTTDPYFIDSLGISRDQKRDVEAGFNSKGRSVDPVVEQIIAATCGNLYLDLVGNLPRYPIPNFRLKDGEGKVLVDMGCNWGRWCVAAARAGFLPVGVDPQLGAVLAAKRVAEQLGVVGHFICADARHLPLRAGTADVVFSYSVVQHLNREDVLKVAASANHVLKAGGRLFVQMPNVMGIRCFYQWARRGFSDGTGFDVRYWTLKQLRSLFGLIGMVKIHIDCFFGIGLQPSDADLLPLKWKILLKASEGLRTMARFVPGLSKFADSVYVDAQKPL